MATLGFIGLGRIGAPMARRLIEAGHTLVVHDTNGQAVAALTRFGAQAAPNPASVADAASIVLVSLPTPAIVHTVALGPGGVIEGRAAKIFVDLSTTGARMAQEIATGLARKAIIALDAPVSGGVPGAEKGTLAVMLAGPPAAMENVKPVLSVFGRVFVIGERAGLGQTMKLLNNLLSATAMAATSEAVATGIKAGLDPATMIDVINAGTGRNSASLDKFPRAILPGRYDAGFATGLMMKDVRLCLEEAKALGLSMDVADAVARLWEVVHAEMGAESDFTTIMQTAARRAGVKAPGGQ